ncbi:four helix bundle protein [Gracilimonas sp.]|uniref:four helix bundle protein n=1 Tax=Gracilimonas sp. TaxID=1974203 RepID=UPI003D1383CD
MRKPAKTFKELIVWQKAHRFVLETYKYTKHFPKHELYGLSSQFRRAAVSIPANIAEGFKKRGVRDTMRFLNISHGSLEECRYYIILAKDLNYGSTDHLNNMIEEVSRLLDGYYKALQNSES